MGGGEDHILNKLMETNFLRYEIFYATYPFLTNLSATMTTITMTKLTNKKPQARRPKAPAKRSRPPPNL